VLRDGQSAQDGKKIADDLMTKLEIDSKDLLSGAYMDMLLASDTCDGQPPSNTNSWCIIVSYANKDDLQGQGPDTQGQGPDLQGQGPGQGLGQL